MMLRQDLPIGKVPTVDFSSLDKIYVIEMITPMTKISFLDSKTH